jgi:Limiting CO2-inducible proteins B/C beta carbonyic anhydrases
LRAAVQALAVDDFVARVEVALAAYGFRGDNSLALINVCRDESTGARAPARPSAALTAVVALIVWRLCDCALLPSLRASAGLHA